MIQNTLMKLEYCLNVCKRLTTQCFGLQIKRNIRVVPKLRKQVVYEIKEDPGR